MRRANDQLLEAAARGDEGAWSEIVDRYQGVVWAATFGFRFDESTRSDVAQLTWLRLLDNLDRIREPERLGGWLATTARRECLAIARHRAREELTDRADEEQASALEPDHRLLASESDRAVRAAFHALDGRCQELLRLLVCDPPLSYVEVSIALDIPVGSIGPTRARCLDRLRSHEAMTLMGESGAESR